MEPFNQPIDPREISPEHIVREHRVGAAIMVPFDAEGKPDRAMSDYGIILGLYDGDPETPYLVCVRLLSVQQASQIGTFLLETAAHARALNDAASSERKGGS